MIETVIKKETDMKRTIFITLIASLATSVAVAQGDAAAGKATYDRACKSCHGPTGEHSMNIAKAMKVNMKDLGSADVQSMSDAELKRAVTDGFGKMRPIRSVSGTDLDNVVAYIRTFK